MNLSASAQAGLQAYARAPLSPFQPDRQPAPAAASDGANRLIIEQHASSISFSASVSQGDGHYSLLLQASYESISARFEAAGIPTAEAPAQPAPAPEAGQIDLSPEATAGRIADFATGLYELFKQQHVGEDEGAVFDNFMKTIGAGIEQGFKEAREILQGLGRLQGDVASNVDKTWELVQQKLQAFADKTRPDGIVPPASPAASNPAPAAA